MGAAGYKFLVKICDLRRRVVEGINLIFSVTIQLRLRSNAKMDLANGECNW
jgi:hypothetical protein